MLRRRSDSIDRRLSEAAQFAAVVGDVPVDIRIIEDHDDFRIHLATNYLFYQLLKRLFF